MKTSMDTAHLIRCFTRWEKGPGVSPRSLDSDVGVTAVPPLREEKAGAGSSLCVA